MALFLLYLSIYGYFKRHLCEIMLYIKLLYMSMYRIQNFYNSSYIALHIYIYIYILYIYIYITLYEHIFPI